MVIPKDYLSQRVRQRRFEVARKGRVRRLSARSWMHGVALSLALGSVSLSASAQGRLSPSLGNIPTPNPPNANAQEASADTFIVLGAQILQQLDQGQVAAVWDKSSPALQARVTKETLQAGTAQVRQALGPLASRTWVSVARLFIPDTPGKSDALPGGFYTNLNFLTQAASGRKVSELVSFRLEADNTWRLTGYVPRDAP